MREMPKELRAAALPLTEALIGDYLEALRDRGRKRESLGVYRRCLTALYDYLPPEKVVRRETLGQWRDWMLAEGYAAQTVNCGLSAANGLLDHCGRRDLQLTAHLRPGKTSQPELTRQEYLRLLRTARLLGRERAYLLMKAIAGMGLSLEELAGVTAEGVREGCLRGSGRTVRIPECLRRELLDYARQAGIAAGPLFTTRNGRLMSRSNVTDSIRALCRDARVPEGKGNPRCLKKLYQTTQAEIQSGLAVLAEQAHDRLLEAEQMAIGGSGGEVRRL